jgi:hypothetical protein
VAPHLTNTVWRRFLSYDEGLHGGAGIATFERPARFSAVSLEKVLDFFLIEAKKEQLALQESREELLSRWQSMISKYFEESWY